MKYFIYICLFFIIVLLFSYFNTRTQQEAFTPTLRQLYRPYVRDARIMSEGFYGNNSNDISDLFRKFGIM
jgi:hypothetical protein